MDLATCISEAASAAFKRECETNTCNIKIYMCGGKYKYTLMITPMAKHIIIRYNRVAKECIIYKIPREDKESYEDVVDTFVTLLNDDCDNALADDIQYNGYWPDMDENHEYNSLVIERKNEKVFTVEFKRENFDQILKLHMRSMRFLN